MKVKLNRTFSMPAPADRAWVLLQDVASLAACMPGSKITEQVDATHYRGTLSVKVGPASLSFRGDVEVKGVDAAARSMHLFAKGTDTTGSSGASMDLTARVEPRDASSCSLVGDSEVSMSGKAAGFGARMMGVVAEQVINEFGANFATRLEAMSGQATQAQALAAPVSAARPLGALGLLWRAMKAWFRTLFAKA